MAPSTGQRDIIVVSTIIKMGLQDVHNSIFVAPLGLLCTSILNYSQTNNKQWIEEVVITVSVMTCAVPTTKVLMKIQLPQKYIHPLGQLRQSHWWQV